jgi:SAM-dependent methyltransferase
MIGLDFNLTYLKIARQANPEPGYICADALHLPYPAGCFDAVVCHFFLLWIPDPAAVLNEMIRAARPGSAVIAFAEPDYGGRIDYPPELEELGRLQTQALKHQGADPYMGRKLNKIFHQAGLHNIETGLLGGQWSGAPSQAQVDSEWDMLITDLAGMLSNARLQELRRHDSAAWQAGRRVLFVPTFYAIGYKA